MAKPGNTGIGRIVKAARFSAQGLVSAWRHEAAFRQELIATLLLAPVALWLGQTTVERILLLGSCLLVILTELLNSAIEATVDRFGAEHHELSGRAKDLASAAVFVSLIIVALVWVPLIWQRMNV